MATSETTQRPELPLPRSEIRPARDTHIGPVRRLRRDAGAFLEYLWELSASVRRHRAAAILFEGKEATTGLPITAFYFGHGDNYAFLLNRLCTEHRVIERRERLHPLGVRRWVAQFSARASLLCADVELLPSRLLPADSFLRVPQWVRQKYAVPGTWAELLGSLRKNTRATDLRKVRKYGFTYRITSAEEEFRAFYSRMYVPYLRGRFAEEAIIEPEWKVLRQCRKGELLQVLREGRLVAAVLLHRLAGRLAYVWVGVPEDVEGDLFRGAFSALYYFTLLYGFECGCREIDFLGSRPLLNDGLFHYKRKWGTHVEDSPVPRGDILLRPVIFDEAVRGFFASNSFIVRDGAELVGKVLLEGAPVTRSRLEEVLDQLHTSGLREIKVFSMSGFEPEALSWAAGPDVPLRLRDLGDSSDPARDFCRF